MTTPPEGLLVAIDAGDDSVLPILADWLEDQGDSRTDGLRAILARRLCPRFDYPVWVWYLSLQHLECCGAYLTEEFFALLVGGQSYRSRKRNYLSKAAAFLDLAEAVVRAGAAYP